MLLHNILEAIGKTPIVRINRIGHELPCELLWQIVRIFKPRRFGER